MKKIIAIAASAAVSVTTAGLMLVGGGIAVGAEPDNCADAVVALNEANVDHRAAVDADKKAADAKAADEALERAEDRLKVAQEELEVAEFELSQIPDPPAQGEDPAKAARDAAQKKVDDARAKVDDLTEARDNAKKLADATDAGALQDEADKTDVVATQRVLDEARADFDRECTEGEDPTAVPTTPPAAPADTLDCGDFSDRAAAQAQLDADRSDPHVLDADNDGQACDDFVYGSSDVDVPSGGVDTGGGPA